MNLKHMTWPEFRQARNQGLDTAVFPIGSLEQHGHHCPLGTDGLIAAALAQGAAEKLGALCLPPLWYGVAPHHMDFPGTLTLKPKVMLQVVEDVLDSLIHQGIKNILIINGHGGNIPATTSAGAMVRLHHPEVFIAQSAAWLVLQEVYDDLPAEAKKDGWRMLVGHGGLLETSMVLALAPEAVKLEEAKVRPADKPVLAGFPGLSVIARMSELTEVGSYGDPTGATAELGRVLLDKSIEVVAAKYRAALKIFRG